MRQPFVAGLVTKAEGLRVEREVFLCSFDWDSLRPKVLAIGPDRAGNLLEIIWLELADDVNLVIHAMPLRPTFTTCFPNPGRTCHDRPENPPHSQRSDPHR